MAWLDVAACREAPDPDAWFTMQPHRLRAALRVCGGCPVRRECSDCGQDDPNGVWGGSAHGESQRAALARGRV